jgi:uncharacterized protein (TIGR02145 family)
MKNYTIIFLITLLCSLGLNSQSLVSGTQQPSNAFLLSDSALVAYLPLNGNTSDASGNGHHSTSNGVSYTFDRFGNPNSAAEFNGEKNTISFKGFQMSGPGSTIAFWVKPTVDTDTIMVNAIPLSLKMVLRIVDRKYDLEITLANKIIHLKSDVPVNFNSAHQDYDFIAIYFKNEENSVLLGVNQRSIDVHYFTPGEIDNLFPLTVRKDPVYFFKGKVDDIRIYSRALTYEEFNILNGDRFKRVPEIRIDSLYIGRDYARLYTFLIDDYSVRIEEYGICLSTHPTPDTTDTKYKFHGYFDRYFMSRLLPATKYYIRVYGKNEIGLGFSNEVSFETPPNVFGSLTDIDGNIYRTIKIGAQNWMAENLKTTRYANGTPINNGDMVEDITTGKYYFHNIEELKPYGLFYTWQAASNTDSLHKTYPDGLQGVCPIGWHLPNVKDYNILIDYLGGSEIAGQKLRTAGEEFWEIDNGTDESGFGAMGLGEVYKRKGIKYPFFGAYGHAYFWTSEADTSRDTEFNWATIMALSKDVTAYIHPYLSIYVGASVRCIQDTISQDFSDKGKAQNPSAKFFIYPNPASDVLYLPNLTGSATVAIYDTESRLRLKTNVSNGQVNIASLPKGIYIIQISDGVNTQKRKFVK